MCGITRAEGTRLTSVAQWLKENSAARRHVERWLQARKEGADASFKSLAEQLRQKFKHTWEPGALARALDRVYPGCTARPARVEQDENLTDEQQLERHEARSRAAQEGKRQEQVIRELERRNAELQRLFRGLKFYYGDDNLDYVEADPIRPLGTRGPLPEATYGSAASDWHPGMQIRYSETNGLNEFTPEIFELRAERFFQRNLLMLNSARSAWDVNTYLLWLGGDLMENFLHDENYSENTLSPTEECVLLFNTLKRGIDFLLAKSNCARIRIVTNNGNHGRNTKKMHAAGAFRRSYEFMIYQLLQQHYADEPRIEWQLCLGYEHIVDIYGWKLRTHHGDAIKYNSGVGGIAPALYRRIGRAAQYADWDLMGHFHQWQFMTRAMINGSLCGYNSFAQRLGFPFEEPIQISWVLDAKHKVPSNMNPIFCKEERRPTTRPR